MISKTMYSFSLYVNGITKNVDEFAVRLLNEKPLFEGLHHVKCNSYENFEHDDTAAVFNGLSEKSAKETFSKLKELSGELDLKAEVHVYDPDFKNREYLTYLGGREIGYTHVSAMEAIMEQTL